VLGLPQPGTGGSASSGNITVSTYYSNYNIPSVVLTSGTDQFGSWTYNAGTYNFTANPLATGVYLTSTASSYTTVSTFTAPSNDGPWSCVYFPLGLDAEQVERKCDSESAYSSKGRGFVRPSIVVTDEEYISVSPQTAAISISSARNDVLLSVSDFST